jgi:hypothetical protein
MNKINQQISITFETKCYENDWEYLLKTRHLEKMIENCNVNFQFKQLIINNVEEPEKVRRYAEKKIAKNVIDAYYFVDDYIDEALKFFDIDKHSFGNGYYYSNAELAGLFLSKTEYHLHFAGDSFMQKKHGSRWIVEACNILENHPEYLVANPAWNFKYHEAEGESTGKTTNGFYVGFGFSDQCYLVRTNDFRQKIYHYKHPFSERYPEYGGELFEKRVDSYMRIKKLYRITSMNESYIHRNFPKTDHKLFVLLLLKLSIYYVLPSWNIKDIITGFIKKCLKCIKG